MFSNPIVLRSMRRHWLNLRPNIATNGFREQLVEHALMKRHGIIMSPAIVRTADAGLFTRGLFTTSSESSGYSTQTEKAAKNNKGNKSNYAKKFKLLALAFSVGSVAGLGYVFSKRNHQHMPIANVETGNEFLFSVPPPEHQFAKRVSIKPLF